MFFFLLDTSCFLDFAFFTPDILELDLFFLHLVLSAEKEWKRRNQRFEEDEELDDDGWGLRVLQRQELNKVKNILFFSSTRLKGFCQTRPFLCFPQIQSNLGKILLKEELDRSAAPLRRKPRSLPGGGKNPGMLRPLHSFLC